MFKRIKKALKIWEASKQPEVLIFDSRKITPEQMQFLQEGNAFVIPKEEVKGDGKAEFFGEPTPEEMIDYQRELDGTLPWYKRITKL